MNEKEARRILELFFDKNTADDEYRPKVMGLRRKNEAFFSFFCRVEPDDDKKPDGELLSYAVRKDGSVSFDIDFL
jgi:hypothetical protein